MWVHGAATVLEATFAHSLNMIGTSVLVVEMGVGMRMTKEYCKQLIGLCKGKKLYDKRQDISKRDQLREAQRDFKVRNFG